MVPRRNGDGIRIATQLHLQHAKAEQSEGVVELATERTVGHESESVVGKWRKLCNEELYNLCFSSHIY